MAHNDSKLQRDRKAAKTTRRYFDEDIKRKSVEDLLSGKKTRAELCKELDIQPSQLLAWMGLYGERRQRYAAVEAASAAHATPLAESIVSGLDAVFDGGNTGVIQEAIQRAVGKAVLDMLAKKA